MREVLAAVLGADVSASRSPAIHEAAYRALGLRGLYLALDVTAARFRRLVADLREVGFRYANVTIPHKRAAAALATARSPEVRASGAANTLLFRDRGMRAENTDGHGLVSALADLGATLAGEAVVLVGAGGAAAGVIPALVGAGARVRVLARRPAVARRMCARLPTRVRPRVTVAPWDPAALAGALAGAAVLVSAVPAVAWTPDAARAGLRDLGRGAAVFEMAYGAETPLARAARLHTPRYADGISMLVHQAARAIELALGERPPLAPLFRAARG